MARRNSILSEFVAFLRHNRAYWMIPLVTVLLLLAAILVFGGTAAAPFIYTVF